MRLAVPFAIVALLAAGLLGGCGGGSSSTSSTGGGAPATEGAPPGASAQACGSESLRATGVSCAEAKSVLLAWQRGQSCAGTPGASHSACSVRGYRCIGARTERGLAVSCAQPGRAIAFIVQG
jgi:hypothetical protein